MASLNRVTLIGNVGRDPEIRATQGGSKIANLSIATTDKWKDKNGERHERTEWHRAVIFNEGLVGIVEKYVRKGSQIMIEGSLQTRKWQDQSGQDRYSTEVVLSAYNGQIILLDKPSGQSRENAPSNGHSEPAAGKPMGGGGKAFDDEIPF
jgi:single-strand DNA-binding protein